MTAQSIDETHRGTSQLELLFVVAIATIAAQSAQRIAEGKAIDGVTPVPPGVLAIS